MNNLRELQKIDPQIEKILVTVSRVALYEFKGDLQQWICKDVEGPLFVVERTYPSLSQFIVLNRRNAENMVVDLSPDFEFRVIPQYMVYRKAAQEFNGIWFSSEQAADEVAAVFYGVLTEHQAVSTMAGVSASSSSTPYVINDQLESSGRSKSYTLNDKVELDKTLKESLNLRVLRQEDPSIEKILITISYVSLYEYLRDLNLWVRKNVQGPLFVVERNHQQRFQFIVLNDNQNGRMVEDLSKHMVFGVMPPYLVYYNAAKITGIWFYNECASEEFADILGRILGANSMVPLNQQFTKSALTEHQVVPTSTATEGSLRPAFTSSMAGVGASGSSTPYLINIAATTEHAYIKLDAQGIPIIPSLSTNPTKQLENP